jgi:NAD(P)-dependent dehydrogenase (short-subunit alcohol dehydrogenase family)
MGANLLLVSRDPARGEAARAEIAAAGGGEVQLFLADLASQEEIRRLSHEIHARVPRLDVLINNAGAIFTKRTTTVDGLESTFAVNHLAYFLLTNLLLDLLTASAPARIVNVSSGSHLNAHMNFDDLQGEHGYGGWKAYSQSKLANVLFTYALARRLSATAVTANAVHPGVVATNFGQTGGFLRFGIRAARRFFLTAAEGADTVVYLASADEVEGVSGRYFVKRKPVTSSRESRDPQVQERLWTVSEELTRLRTATEP